MLCEESCIPVDVPQVQVMGPAPSRRPGWGRAGQHCAFSDLGQSGQSGPPAAILLLLSPHLAPQNQPLLALQDCFPLEFPLKRKSST